MRNVAGRSRHVDPEQIVGAGLCIGCGSCVAQSETAHAEMRWDRYGQLKPDFGTTPSPAAFDRTCPFAPAAANEDELSSNIFATPRCRDESIGSFEAAYVGHAEQGDFRSAGSSGGLVSWMAAELLRRGLVDGVAHVVKTAPTGSEGRLFRYAISRTPAEICAGAGSRYYPVEMSDILRTIRAVPGRYAVVGIPCFIKALHLLRMNDEIFRRRIVYTLGLFCGHMKSARFVDSIARQTGVEPSAVTGIDYRMKMPDRPANWYRARLTLADGSVREKDWWHLADGDWGAGFFQNSACNYCDDVTAETADVAFGDAWVEPYSSDGRGTNVVVVRKPELVPIVSAAVRDGRISLLPVDARFVEQTQAAGLRQRREGLAYRLAWKPPLVPLEKRVRGESRRLPVRRKLVYRSRFAIARWSHLVFAVTHSAGASILYERWAGAALSLYQGLTYSRGLAGRLSDAFFGSKPV